MAFMKVVHVCIIRTKVKKKKKKLETRAVDRWKLRILFQESIKRLRAASRNRRIHHGDGSLLSIHFYNAKPVVSPSCEMLFEIQILPTLNLATPQRISRPSFTRHGEQSDPDNARSIDCIGAAGGRRDLRQGRCSSVSTASHNQTIQWR